MAFPNYLYSAFTNKCPRCHHGRVFENNNPYSFTNGLTMNKHCPNCGLKYEREVGYFYGAMYVSYAIQVLVFGLLYGISALWLHLDAGLLIALIIVTVVGMFPVTFRWSRIMWIAFFTKYDRNFYKVTQ